MDERLKFVALVLDGEPMSEVCRFFGISRKTGYKTIGTRRAGWRRGATPSAVPPRMHASKAGAF